MLSTSTVGMKLRSTWLPGAAGPKIDGAFEETKRRPLISVSVRLLPRPKRLTKFRPGPKVDWPPSGVMPVPKPGVSFSASAIFVRPRASMYSRGHHRGGFERVVTGADDARTRDDDFGLYLVPGVLFVRRWQRS